MLYLLNSPTLFANGLYRMSGPLELADARALAASGFKSAIGHRSTAWRLEQLLGLPVQVNRCRIKMQPGDSALVFRVLARLPEGRVLTNEELARLPWQLSLIERES